MNGSRGQCTLPGHWQFEDFDSAVTHCTVSHTVTHRLGQFESVALHIALPLALALHWQWQCACTLRFLRAFLGFVQHCS